MSEIRFVTSSDEHLACNNVGLRKGNYRDDILDKLVWQGRLARSLDADAMLRGGDFFHHKNAAAVTMSTLGKAAAVHREYHCPTYSISGNHDMSKNDPTSIPKQPLGVLFKSGVFNPLTDTRFHSGTMSVRVIGVDYTVGLDNASLREKVRKVDGDTYTIAFVHALASMAPSEKIQSFFNETIFDYRDLVFEGCPDVYIFGHYHKDQGIVDHNGVQFVNLGAVSRGALTFENLDRKPKVSSITCNSRGISIEEHMIPSKDATEIFDLEKKKAIEKERKSIDEFISKLSSDRKGGSNSSIDAKLSVFKDSDYPKDLKKLIIDTIESAEAGTLE